MHCISIIINHCKRALNHLHYQPPHKLVFAVSSAVCLALGLVHFDNFVLVFESTQNHQMEHHILLRHWTLQMVHGNLMRCQNHQKVHCILMRCWTLQKVHCFLMRHLKVHCILMRCWTLQKVHYILVRHLKVHCILKSCWTLQMVHCILMRNLNQLKEHCTQKNCLKVTHSLIVFYFLTHMMLDLHQSCHRWKDHLQNFLHCRLSHILLCIVAGRMSGRLSLSLSHNPVCSHHLLYFHCFHCSDQVGYLNNIMTIFPAIFKQNIYQEDFQEALLERPQNIVI